MAKPFVSNRKSILVVCCLVCLLSTVAFALRVRSSSQPAQKPGGKEKNEALKLIETAPEQTLRILGNDDCPLRIVEAKVKEVPGAFFTKFTGKMTDLETVPSVPEVRLINTSGQTVEKFLLLVRNPEAEFTRGVGRKIAIKPGETYTVEREYFAAPEKVMSADGNGQVQEVLAPLQMDSEKMWLSKGARSDVYVTIIKIKFEDGSNWTLKEGGEVR